MASFFVKLKSFFTALIFLFMSVFVPNITGPAQMPEVEMGEYARYVDPFIGTGGLPWVSGMLFPGATAPFGLVRLSPDTAFPAGLNPFKMGTAGYYYGHNTIWGFSHTRLSGTGAVDMGHFRVTPVTGKMSAADRLSSSLPFSHDKETATAGYYAVYLPSISCLAELTATQHVGVHRYSFDTSKDARILIDATSFLAGGRAEEGRVKVNPETYEVEGEARVFTGFTGRYGGLKGYFVAKFDTPFKSFATWEGSAVTEGKIEAFGNDTGADLNFGNLKGKSVELKVGISFVSLENARENLEFETEGKSFDTVRDEAVAEWNARLSKIKIDTNDKDIKKIFYTALYHSMIMPTNFTDVNGQYLGFNEKVGVAEVYTYRTDLSLWDTVRTTHPLYTLIEKEIQLDSVKSLIAMAEESGALPRWPSGAGESGSMFGTPADLLIAETYLKGLTDFDAEKAYNFMKNTALETDDDSPAAKRDYNKEYLQYGYIPAQAGKRSVSYALEYAWEDYSIALLAEALGKFEDAEFFKERSKSYKNIFNPETKYFQAKSKNGTFVEPFSPYITTYYDEVLPIKVSSAYVEGSPRQWRWSVQHDPQGLIELFGDRDYFISELEQFMKDATPKRAAIDPGSGYWHGNQHDLHAVYLFIDAGRPDLAQKWIRWVLTDRYGTGADGLDGNDDGGTLSAWYVLSAVGIYPMAGTDKYYIGAPIVDSAELDLGNGNILKVRAVNQSKDNIYVSEVTFNGEKLTEPYITHALLDAGGELVFTMSPTPAENGGF